MKRRTLKLAACATIMALALVATACGSGDKEAKEAEAEVEETVEEAEVEEPEAEAEAEAIEDTKSAEEDEEAVSLGGSYASLEDFYNDPAIKPALDGMFEAMAQEGMSVALEVNGNEFKVIIKIEDSSMVVDGMGEYLDQTLEAMAPTFEAQVAQFDDAIGEAGACTVVMCYTGPDDSVLAEKAFKAQ